MRNIRLVTEAWKISPSLWPSRRAALAMVFAGLVIAYGPDEAEARAMHGGIAAAGGGSETTLGAWTVTNNTGSTMTNVPVEVPVLFSSASGSLPFASTDALKVYDSDGTTVIPVQECNRFSDVHSDIRGNKAVIIIPSLPSGARQLTLKKVANTSPTSGTEITAAEITTTGFSLAASMAHRDGTTYTADAATGLAASTWTNKTTAANKGTWLQGGGLATSYVVTCPFKNGGTAAPDNLQLWAEVTAYKAQRGAVSGGNPIIAIRCQYWITCGIAQASDSTIINHWFDLSVSCGSNSQNWVGSTPSTTLTFSSRGNSNTGASVATATAGSSVFTANSVGMVISDGAGGSARITKYNSGTSVNVKMANEMNSLTYSSGAWRIFGMNMAYPADIPPQEIWYGGSLAITTQPDILSHLGAAWNGSTGGPFSWFTSTKMILPYTTPVGSVSNSVTKLDLCGTNPTGMADNGFIADWVAYMPTSGGYEERAPVPGWAVGGLIKYDSNGRRRIFENARKYALYPMWYIDENTGKAPTFNCGADYFYGINNWFGDRLPLADQDATSNREYNASPGTPQLAHRPNPEQVPAYLTGDFYWVERLHKTLFFIWASNNSASLQLNRLGCNYSEFRGNGWSHLTLMSSILLTPDRDPAPLSYTRSLMTTWWNNHYTYTGSGTPGGNPAPGINLGLINNTGVGKGYATSGPRSMTQQAPAPAADAGNVAQWQLGYTTTAFFMMKGAGMDNTYMSDFMTWFMEGVTGAATSADVVPNWCVPSYYLTLQADGTGVNVNTWADVYKASCHDICETALNVRLVTSTGMSASALSGSGITLTLPSGYLTNGGNTFYTGGYVIDGNSASFQVTPMAPVSGYSGNACMFRTDAGPTSSNRALPTNNGSVRIYNTGANTIYVKLSVGAGTATTSDTAITAGSSAAFNVGSNTYVNWITASGFSTLTGFGSVGATHAVNDQITVSVGSASSGFSITTHAVLRVDAIGPNGDINQMSIVTPGLYIANSNYSHGPANTTVTQTSTTGSGTGFVYEVASNADSSFNGEGSTQKQCPLKFGTAIITGVSGNVITMNTGGAACVRGSRQVACWPFAQTTFVTNRVYVPGPYPGDSNGYTGSGSYGPYVPTPYSGTNEYWAIAKASNYLANLYGFANAAASWAIVNPAYTGSQEIQWKVD